jgi:hypothetical protein
MVNFCTSRPKFQLCSTISIALGIFNIGLKYCDMHTVGLMSQQKKNALLGNGWPRNNVKAAFSTTSDPRLYN